MATFQSTQFIQFVSPLSNPPFCNNNSLWSSEPSRSNPPFNASGSQKIYKPTAAVSHSGYQTGLDRNTTARAEDDDLLSLEHSLPSVPAQAQAQTLRQSSAPQQDQTNPQSVSNAALSASVEPAPYSLPKLCDSGDDGWTDEDTAELERELGLALEERQVKSLSTGALTSPSSRSVEAPQDESRERTETTCSGLTELRDPSRHGTAQGLEEWELQETEIVDGGGVAMQEQEQEELEKPHVGDQQDLVEVSNADDTEHKEATEALLATQPKTDEHRFRLRGIRALQLPGRQTKITQYRIVWGQRPNRSDSWLNKDEIRMSMPRLPHELCTQSLALSTDIDISRVCKMRPSEHKGKKGFEYLVNAVGIDNNTWITQDQLKISLSPILVLQLKGSSPHPLSETQRDVLLKHSATPIRDGHDSASRASRSSSASADPALDGEPATRKRGHQDAHTKISSDTNNTDENHNACDASDEDPLPAKRRKPRSAPELAPTASRGHTPELQVGKPAPLVALSTATAEINNAQPQVDHEFPSTFVDNSHQNASRPSRSPSVASETAPVAEYQEWPFQGFLKCVTIGNQTTYNLEFTLPYIPKHVHFSLNPNVLGVGSRDSLAEAVVSHKAVASRKSGKELTKEQESLLAKMVHKDKTWTEIGRHFPDHTLQSLKENFFTKQGGKPRKRGRKPGVRAGGV